jgi:hypothetical protein
MGAFRNRVLEEHSFLKRTLGGGGSFAIRDRLDPAPAVIASASSSVLHHAGLVRRPQRPGTQRVNASGKPLQQFTLENRWQAPTFRNHGSAQDIPRSTGGTLLEGLANRNNKLMFGCEEPVEDEDSLWKGKEKPGKFMAPAWHIPCRRFQLRVADYRSESPT